MTRKKHLSGKKKLGSLLRKTARKQKSEDDILRILANVDITTINFWYEEDRQNYLLELNRATALDSKAGILIGVISLVLGASTIAINYIGLSTILFIYIFCIIGYLSSICGIWLRHYSYFKTPKNYDGILDRGEDELKKIYTIRYREFKEENQDTIDVKVYFLNITMIMVLLSSSLLLLGLVLHL